MNLNGLCLPGGVNRPGVNVNALLGCAYLSRGSGGRCAWPARAERPPRARVCRLHRVGDSGPPRDHHPYLHKPQNTIQTAVQLLSLK